MPIRSLDLSFGSSQSSDVVMYGARNARLVARGMLLRILPQSHDRPSTSMIIVQYRSIT